GTSGIPANDVVPLPIVTLLYSDGAYPAAEKKSVDPFGTFGSANDPSLAVVTEPPLQLTLALAIRAFVTASNRCPTTVPMPCPPPSPPPLSTTASTRTKTEPVSAAKLPSMR